MSGSSDFSYDVVIVGAGVAGLMLALNLRKQIPHICIIESGASRPEDYYQALNHMESTGLRYDTLESRARAFGGSMHLWAGRCGVLDKIDYQKRSWVEHSGWPISADDLEPYYRRALTELQYSYDAAPVLNPDIGDKTPFPELEAKYFALLDHVNGNFVSKYLRAQVKAAPEITLMEKTTALSLQSSDGKSVDSILAAYDGRTDDALKPSTVFGKVFIIASGGLESPRLLLNSGSLHRDGLGHEMVGRFFTDHPRMKSSKFRLKSDEAKLMGKLRELGRKKQQVAYRLNDQSQQRLELLNHSFTISPAKQDIETVAGSAVDAVSGAAPKRKGSPIRRLWRKSPNWMRSGVRALLALRDSRDKVLVFKLELAPNPKSRITLTDTLDRHGMPMAKVDWQITAGDREGLARYFELVGEQVSLSGISDRPIRMPDSFDDRNYKDSSHPIGALRMAESPEQGIVDRDLKVFGTHNLYVCGSAVFPSAGNVNPTLTIAALALRLADKLGRDKSAAEPR